jgi:hypothetical protein
MPQTLRIIPRSEWNALPPKSVTPWHPANLIGVTVHWFGVPAAADRHDLCDDLLRSVQKAHQAGEFVDIAYNHLVCPHGFAYEGRGFDRETGANGTRYANRNYAAVCYMAGKRRGPGVSDEDLLATVEEFALAGIAGCEAKSVAEARGQLAAGVDPFPEIAQDALAFVLAEWFRRGVDRVVVPHHKWTGTDCPGPNVMPWVVDGHWKEDLPSDTRTTFALYDDGGKLSESAPGQLDDGPQRLAAFLDTITATALSHLREEGNLGTVQIRRRVIQRVGQPIE